MTSQTPLVHESLPLGKGWSRRLKVPLVLTFAYLLTGKLGLMLALPPGYASAIFPPAGIAVAAALIGGRRTLPWIFLGSLLLNFWVGYSPSQPITAIGLVAASVIAIASMLQAAVGGWWLRRAVGYPSAFDKASDVWRFLLLAPLICLVSASLSVGSLTLLGIFDAASSTTNWATWWLGDTLGLIVVLPLVLVVAGEPRSLWRNREYSVAVPILLAFALFVFVFIKANRWEQEESLTEYRAHSQRMADQIQDHFNDQGFLLEELNALFSNDPNKKISRDEFHRFVGNSLVRFPNVQAITWAPLVAASQRRRFEAEQRIDFSEFEIREKAENGKLKRAADRAYYYPATYMEPVSPNRFALGFDLASTPDRSLAINRTLETESLVATAPLRLIDDQGPQYGILLMRAVSHRASPGIVMTVLRIGDFIERAPAYQNVGANIRMTDVAARQVMFDTIGDDSQVADYEQTLSFGTRTYRLEFVPTAAYKAQHRGWQSWTVLTVGLFGTGLLGALLMLGTGHTARVEAKVEEYTEVLRESSEKLRSLFDLSPLGIALMDAEGHFIEFNEAFRAICGYSAEELRNMSYSKLTHIKYAEDDIRQMEILNAQGHYGPYEKEYVRKDGSLIPLSFNGVLFTGKSGEKFIWSIVEDITDKKLADKNIHHQARHDALTGLPNRMLYADRLRQAISIAKRDKAHLALIYIDLDKFKPVNDTLGHSAGDELLRTAADRMLECVRESDTVARIGGDEFVVLLPAIKIEEDALRVAEKIRLALAQPFNLTGNHVSISSSIGIAVYPEHGDDGDLLFQNADRAMYYAKRKGRDNVQLYRDGIGDFSETLPE